MGPGSAALRLYRVCSGIFRDHAALRPGHESVRRGKLAANPYMIVSSRILPVRRSPGALQHAPGCRRNAGSTHAWCGADPGAIMRAGKAPAVD
jgi:hypothetical protein